MKAKQMLMDFGGTDVNVWPGRAVDGFIAAQLDESPTEEPRLMETILERGNMLQALKRVESNKGAPGVDGMTTAQLRGYLNRHWDKIKDRLMMRLAARVKDKRVLKLIRAYLNSGALVGGVVEWTGEGTPQGGPLSPLLANIVLDELDKELEKRGLRFVRYADDVAIYVRTLKAAERVKHSVSRFITDRLKLSVNEKKSAVGWPWHSKYLGFRITRFMGKTRTGIHPDSIKRFRKKVREITARERGVSLAKVVGELNSLLRGWAGYFRPGLRKTLAKELDHWIRRRLRAYVWGSPKGNGLPYSAATERSGVATSGNCHGRGSETSCNAASSDIGRWRSATPARVLGGSAKTERVARRCLTSGSPVLRGSFFLVHSVNKRPNR